LTKFYDELKIIAYANNGSSSIRPMKICLPTNDNLGLQSELASNFSAANWLLVVESEIQETRAIDMSDEEQRSRPVDLDVIVCHGMPEVLYKSLRAEGIPIYGTRSRNVAGALVDYWDDDLHDLESPGCCQGDRASCDGDHVDDAPDCPSC
jgi:predicted Fe-Mo cluster-binding NifX family protein